MGKGSATVQRSIALAEIGAEAQALSGGSAEITQPFELISGIEVREEKGNVIKLTLQKASRDRLSATCLQRSRLIRSNPLSTKRFTSPLRSSIMTGHFCQPVAMGTVRGLN